MTRPTTAPQAGAEADSGTQLRLDVVRGWMLDVDGCLVRTTRPGGEGGTAFEGAAEFVAQLRAAGHRVVCCTNASGQPPRGVADELRRMGIEMADEDVLTAGAAGVHRVALRHPGASVLAIGTRGIVEPLRGAGLHVIEPSEGPADVVLVGAHHGLTSAELDTACASVADGAAFYATVRTPWFYGGDGRSASMTAATAAGIEWITGVVPEVVGKPSRAMAQLVLDRLELEPEHLVIVGDGLEAEVGMAADIGAQSVWVRSGAPSNAGVDGARATPTLTVAHIGELLELFRSSH